MFVKLVLKIPLKYSFVEEKNVEEKKVMRLLMIKKSIQSFTLLYM